MREPDGAISHWASRLTRAFRSSGRLQLTTGLVTLLAVAGTAIDLSLEAVLDRQLENRIRSALVQEYEEFRRFLQLGRRENGTPVSANLSDAGRRYLARTVLARGEVVVIADIDGRVSASPTPTGGTPLNADQQALQALTTDASSRIENLTVASGDVVRVLSVPILRDRTRIGTFIVGQFVGPEREEIAAVQRAARRVTLATVAILALTSWWIAGLLLRPLRRMTATAQRVTADMASERLDDPGGRDEVAVLSRTFNQMLDRLETALSTQRTFLADTAHDLRTPLTITRGHLEQLRTGLVPESAREETLAIIADELERMSRLVDDMLMLARSARPDFLRYGEVDVGDLTQEVLRRARSLPGPAWRVDAGSGVIRADADRLTRALLNLAENAARYTHSGTDVVVGSRIEAYVAHFWIADRGPGVPPDQRERIFERHARGAGRSEAGSGLGLAIARAIAEAHGGRLVLDESWAPGARLVLTVPVLPPRRSAL